MQHSPAWLHGQLHSAGCQYLQAAGVIGIYTAGHQALQVVAYLGSGIFPVTVHGVVKSI